jgi:hypothetical protein
MTIDIDLYRTRRARVLEAIAARGGGVAILPTAPEALRNRDSDLHDLTGFPERKARERFEHIGVRIEDDVLVTPSGCEVLTHEAPKRPDDIEALMRR